jgi:putative endonuclease
MAAKDELGRRGEALAREHLIEAGYEVIELARLRRLAGAWCEAHPGHRGPIRLDAIAVIAPAGGAVTIEHLVRVF